MPKLIFDDGTTVELCDHVYETACRACGMAANDCETAAKDADRNWRHALAEAMRASAAQYRNAERALQGDA